MVKYIYDAWGNHSVLNPDGTENKSSTFLGNINPFRYRGYYYDAETGLYFLKTRYYDPEVGRFITIDDISYLSPDIINGLNLYAYCNNNPVINVDPNGTSWWKNVKNWFKNKGRAVGNILIAGTGLVGVAGGMVSGNSSIGNNGGFGISIGNDSGFGFDFGSKPKSIFDIFKEGIKRKNKFIKEVVWDDWIVDKFGRKFLKGIVWDKGIVPAWNWLKNTKAGQIVWNSIGVAVSLGGMIISLLGMGTPVAPLAKIGLNMSIAGLIISIISLIMAIKS